MDAKAISKQLGGKGYKDGKGYKCRCPNTQAHEHGDQTPSARVSDTQDGGVVFACHKGCDPKLIWKIAKDNGLVPQLPPQQQNTQPKESKRPKLAAVERKIVKIYPYYSQNCQLIFEKVRYDPKDFRLRQEGANGEYIWSTKGLDTTIPYMLPEITAAIEAQRTIYIAEGEKDVDNITEKLKLDATCNAHGASEDLKRPKWTDETSKWLSGIKTAVILADNDSAGKAHAEAVAASLTRMGAKCKIVDLPGLKPKGDVSDWLESGGTREDLVAIVQKTKPWKPPAVAETKIDDSMLPINSKHRDEIWISPLSDRANGVRFLDIHKQNYLFVRPNSWVEWSGAHYKTISEQEALQAAYKVGNLLEIERKEASEKAQEAYAKATKRANSVAGGRATLESAAGRKGCCSQLDDFDKDPWLINCNNGTLDLRTGSLREHSQSDRCSKIINVDYDPEAKCPLWDAFLNRIMASDEQMLDFLDRALGYSLTGDIGEECLFFCYGEGANGKSKFLETIQALLGPYATTISSASLSPKSIVNGSGPSPDIAKLRGARFVGCNETSSGQRFDDALLKDLTGGDTITARLLHQNEVTFIPQFKLWIRGNHKPSVTADYGVFRRMHLIPFTVTIPVEERDKQLAAKLRNELPGIFARIVRGCLAWQKDGLKVPESVSKATEEYRQENDKVTRFVDECCALEPEQETAARNLYHEYKLWCERSGLKPEGELRFLSGLKLLPGVEKKQRTKYARLYKGIRILHEHEKDQRQNPKLSDVAVEKPDESFEQEELPF